MFITGIAVAVFILICIIYVLTTRKKAPRVEVDEDPTTRELESPKVNVLEDREILDGPVEIRDDMSLAEIKRLKSARIRTKSTVRRATAVEATEASKKKHEEKALSLAVDPVTLAEPSDDELETASSHEKDAKKEIEQPITVKETPSKTTADETTTSKSSTTPSVNKTKATKVKESASTSKPKARTLEDGLAKTRSGFIDRLGGLFKKEKLDEDLVDEVEEILFTADIGPKAASHIMTAIEDELHKDAKQNPAEVWSFVRSYVKDILSKRQTPIDTTTHKPFVFLMIGVNGVGKTTTIGKLASKFRHEGKSVLMVAGDTFRAAAVEQLEVWGERTGIEVYKGAPEQDPASVVYEGIEKALKEEIDIVICDTAGRLQSNTNLLDELGKIGRVAGKVVEGAPHETLLVLDANTGQNALLQARKFNEAVNISGIVLTKLDGTAKGGIILGISDEIDVPIRYIGIGEAVEDLRPFDADEFVEALFM